MRAQDIGSGRLAFIGVVPDGQAGEAWELLFGVREMVAVEGMDLIILCDLDREALVGFLNQFVGDRTNLPDRFVGFL